MVSITPEESIQELGEWLPSSDTARDLEASNLEDEETTKQEDEEIDKSRSEHSQKYVVHFNRDSIEHHETCWTSEAFYVRNFSWRINVRSFDDIVNFDVCSSDLYSDDDEQEDHLTIEVDIDFRIWCQSNRERDIVVKSHTFLDSRFEVVELLLDYDFKSFVDSNNGFVIDKNVVMEVNFKAQPIVYTTIIPCTMLLDEELKDITCDLHKLIHLIQDVPVNFNLNGMTIIPGHRDFLSYKSVVLKDLMTDAGAFACDEPTEIIIPSKIETGAFLCVLRFLYHKKVSFRKDDIKSVLIAADFFHIDHLTRYVLSVLEPQNVFRNIKTYRDEMSNPFVYQYCLRLIDNKIDDVLHDEGYESFHEVTVDFLEELLSRDFLWIDELDLFNAILSWSEAQCKKQSLEVTALNRRKVLGRCSDLIRFPCMSLEDFISTIPSHILSLEEVSQVLLYFLSDEIKSPLRYKTVQRKFKRAF